MSVPPTSMRVALSRPERARRALHSYSFRQVRKTGGGFTNVASPVRLRVSRRRPFCVSDEV
jgi:hypothetical protein